MSYYLQIDTIKASVYYSSNISWQCGESGHHRTSSMSLIIDDKNIIQKIFKADSLIEAKLWEDSDLIMTGVIRPYVSLSSYSRSIDSITVELLDYTEKMHIKVLEKVENVSDNSKVIFSAKYDNKDISYIIENICSKIGILVEDNIKISTVLRRFELSAGDYIDDVIAKLLYEYRYDYKFTRDGKLKIFSTNPEDDSVAEINTFYNNFLVEKKDESNDGCIVKYDKYITVKDYLIGEWSDKAFTLAVLGGYNGSLLDTDNILISYDFSSLKEHKSISVSNLWVSSWVKGPMSGSPSAIITSQSQTNCIVNFRCGGWYYAGTIKYGIKAYADVSYLYEENSSVGYAGSNTDTYTAKYIQDNTSALNLAKAIKIRSASKTIKFNSYEDFDIGSFISLKEDKVVGFDGKVRVISKDLDVDSSLYSYVAESIGDVDISLPDYQDDKEQQIPDSDLDDIFELYADRSSFLVEEEDTEIHISTQGYLFDKYDIKVTFFFNNKKIKGIDGRNLTLKKSSLKTGINTVLGSIIVNGEKIERSITITLIQAGSYSTFEYALSTDKNNPPATEKAFFFDDHLILYNDAIIVEDDIWVKEQLIPADGEYLWMRMLNQFGEWIYVRMTGAEAVDFSISASPSTFQNSARRLTDIIITLNVSTSNIKPGTIFNYQFVESLNGVYFDSTSPNIIRIAPGVNIDYIDVKVIAGAPYNKEKIIRISGIPAADNEPLYLGMIDVMPPANVSKVIDGDFVLYTGADSDTYKDGHLYKYSLGLWSETTSIIDLLKVQDDVMSIIDDKGENYYAKAIFAKSIMATEVAVTGKFIFENIIDGKKAKIEISRESGLSMSYGDANGDTPIIFSANFDSGKIFLGKPDDLYLSPLSGFMYNPATDTLSSRDNYLVIDSQGTIKTPVFEVSISGSVNTTREFSGTDYEKFMGIYHLFYDLTDKNIRYYENGYYDAVMSHKKGTDSLGTYSAFEFSTDNEIVAHYYQYRFYDGLRFSYIYSRKGFCNQDTFKINANVKSEPELILKNTPTQNDYDQLHIGALYKDSDGKLYVK